LLLYNVKYVTKERQQIDLTEISLIELGLTDGKAGLLEVIRQAQNVGLNMCSPDVAPFLRLANFDDKNSHGTEKKHKTPDGAVTVVSEILDEEVHFPKGFYLRKIDNDYWYPNTSQNEIFRQYLTLGGMPYLNNLRYAPEPSRQYLQDLYNSVVLKDVVKRNNIRDVDLLERIIAYITANVGTTFSATGISKYLKNESRTVSPETILNYIKACEDAYLFYRVKRQDLQGKKILTVNEKYFIADHGIREAVFGGNMKDVNLILENIVFLELLRRGYDVTVGKTGDKEIDFVCNKQGQKIYVQVAYLLASEETTEREFGAYDSIRDNFPKYVVTMDDLDMSRNGIKHRNIRDFLLAPNWD